MEDVKELPCGSPDKQACQVKMNKHGYEKNPSREFTDFKILRLIGSGSFGKVYLGLLDGQPLAIKALQKSHIIELKQTEHILQEKECLAQLDHPFIVKMYHS